MLRIVQQISYIALELYSMQHIELYTRSIHIASSLYVAIVPHVVYVAALLRPVWILHSQAEPVIVCVTVHKATLQIMC